MMHKVVVWTAILMCWVTSASFAKDVDYGRFGYWTVYGHIQADGSYGHCGMRTGSKTSKEVLTLTVGQQGYALFLDNSEWKLPSHDKYGVTLNIGEASWGGNATVYTPTGIMMR